MGNSRRGIEKGELPKQTAIRETKEETGFKVKINKKVAEYKLRDKITKHVYHGKIVSGKYVPEYEGCEGKWFGINKLPFFMTAIMKQIISDFNSRNEFTKRNDIPNFDFRNIHLLLIPLLKISK